VATGDRTDRIISRPAFSRAAAVRHAVPGPAVGQRHAPAAAGPGVAVAVARRRAPAEVAVPRAPAVAVQRAPAVAGRTHVDAAAVA